jgi:hypothetical protein
VKEAEKMSEYVYVQGKDLLNKMGITDSPTQKELEAVRKMILSKINEK